MAQDVKQGEKPKVNPKKKKDFSHLNGPQGVDPGSHKKSERIGGGAGKKRRN